jgi:hypothetical protein
MSQPIHLSQLDLPTSAELEVLLRSEHPLFPELEAARQDRVALASSPAMRVILAETEPYMRGIEHIPQTRYGDYRRFIGDGDRRAYETPYFAKRRQLGAAALRLFLGQHTLRDLVQDYLWNVCEESTWVLPAHEDRIIDLFSAETGFMLAETLALLGAELNGEVRARVRREVEARIFEPYLHHHRSLGWYQGGNNWNGVCNSSIGATFLWLDPEPNRVARALTIVFAGLKTFLATAFESDGSSTEGTAYWHYGLLNFIALAELLRARTAGALDLLSDDRLRQIAAYPAKMQLTGPQFANFSDCDDTLRLNPGIISRLAARTGETSLRNLIYPPPANGEPDWRLTMMLRNALWWDGAYPPPTRNGDAAFPAGAVARLVATARNDAAVVLMAKAGHNAENHNQNDVGSFILHVGGETLLCDPGRGLYSRDYFGPRRYENVFNNSYGHSVPRIGEQLQAQGRQYAGQLLATTLDDQTKRVVLELARAYPDDNLAQLRRELTLAVDTGEVVISDQYEFKQTAETVEEAFMTWCEVDVAGASAIVRGAAGNTVRMTIEEPVGATFVVERLEAACQANLKTHVLKRVSFVIPPTLHGTARVRVQIV